MCENQPSQTIRIRIQYLCLCIYRYRNMDIDTQHIEVTLYNKSKKMFWFYLSNNFVEIKKSTVKIHA